MGLCIEIHIDRYNQILTVSQHNLNQPQFKMDYVNYNTKELQAEIGKIYGNKKEISFLKGGDAE